MSEPIVAPRVYFQTFAALLALLLITVGAAYLDLGAFNLALALLIAAAKALLIVFFFMQMRNASRLLHLAALAGVVWLAIMLVLTFGDYLTRA